MIRRRACGEPVLVQNPYGLRRVGNGRWRSLSAESFVQGGLRLSVGVQATSSAPRSPKMSLSTQLGNQRQSAILIGAAHGPLRTRPVSSSSTSPADFRPEHQSGNTVYCRVRVPPRSTGWHVMPQGIITRSNESGGERRVASHEPTARGQPADRLAAASAY